MTGSERGGRIRVAVFLLINTLLFLRCRVFSKRFVPVSTRRGAAQEKVNRHGDRLDVAVFLSSYVADEVVERSVFLASAKVKRLESVVHESGHLTKLATHKFLDCGCGRWVRSVWFGQVHHDFVETLNHIVEETLELRAIDV